MSNFDSDGMVSRIVPEHMNYAVFGRTCNLDGRNSDVENQSYDQIMQRRNGAKLPLVQYADIHLINWEQRLGNQATRYVYMKIESIVYKMKEFLGENFAAMKCCAEQKVHFPLLFRVSCCILACPASSCSSERIFSAIKRILTHDRSRLWSKILLSTWEVRCTSSRKQEVLYFPTHKPIYFE